MFGDHCLFVLYFLLFIIRTNSFWRMTSLATVPVHLRFVVATTITQEIYHTGQVGREDTGYLSVFFINYVRFIFEPCVVDLSWTRTSFYWIWRKVTMLILGVLKNNFQNLLDVYENVHGFLHDFTKLWMSICFSKPVKNLWKCS